MSKNQLIQMGKSEKIKFLIVGCGRIAQTHAKQIASTGLLLGVCDIDYTKADKLAAEYQVKAYYDFAEMLANQEKADVVCICTPNGLHASQSIIALQNGFHVLCEKPMAISPDDCKKMIATAETANRLLFVVKQNRYNPPVIEVKKALDQDRLGRIYSFQLSCFWNRTKDYYSDQWRGTLDLDGGTLFTQFSHFIDLLYWLLGDITDVESYMKNFAHQDYIAFEDTGVVILRFNSGTIGTVNYTVNSFDRNMEGSLTLFGERGTVKIGGQYLNTIDYQEIENYKISDLATGNLANSYGAYHGSMSNHDKVFANIVSVLRDNGAMTTTPFEAMKTVEIISRIYQAADRPIQLKSNTSVN
jgi:UDP-N-acetyl-2-amino-2-deoxyglucuronate dehydrogenase